MFLREGPYVSVHKILESIQRTLRNLTGYYPGESLTGLQQESKHSELVCVLRK